MAKIFVFAMLWAIGCGISLAQRITVTGVVKGVDEEVLPLANIWLFPDTILTSSDRNGLFRIRTKPGEKELRVTYTGFDSLTLTFHVHSDTVITLRLGRRISQLREITVEGNRYTSDDLISSTRTGTTTLTPGDITAIPVLGGEADLIKTLQLLPGTVRGVEGSSDLFVRGGAADQNLVLLDGAPIYNTSHLFGFLSVFNPSVLEKVEAMNGGFPARYGGRLSSILDITSGSRVAPRTEGSGDIGLIASRLYLAQPLVQNKASFWIAGRRTYIDQVVKIIGEEVPYFFYDLNGKLILQPSPANKLQFSFYNGQDMLDIFRDGNNDGVGLSTSYVSGNASQSLQWNHRYRSRWEGSLSLSHSLYRYDISNVFEKNALNAFSHIEDYGARIIFSRDSLFRHSTLTFGAEWVRHAINPNIIDSRGAISELVESSAPKGKITHELAVHVEDQFAVADRWSLNAGMRMSAGLVAGRRYFVPEPRVSLRYALPKKQSVKLAYSRMAQYIHRVSNSAVTTPADVWYTVTDEIAPQTAHQIAAAWQRFFDRHKIFLSAEVYYKRMQNLIGYEEGTNLFFNADFESRLVQGKGRAYGLELLLRKEEGRFTGWISYSLAWSWRQYGEINNGAWFPSRYDRRHNGAIVSQYTFAKRWAASLVWEFMSGARFTPVTGQYVMLAPTLSGLDLIPLYADINSVKLSDSHRLDVGIKFMSKRNKRFRWHWFAGVYNAYDRASPVGMTIEESEEDGSLRYIQPGLFGLLPFISYGFKF